MSLILGIETSGQAASCAVGRYTNGMKSGAANITVSDTTNGTEDSAIEILGFAEIDEPKMHCENLTPLIQKVFEDNKLNIKDISLIAVDVGPGLYTGLRVGIATAMFLAYGLKDVKCIELCSLDLLEHAYRDKNSGSSNQKNPNQQESVISLIDAKRGEVFFSDAGVRGVAKPEELLAKVSNQNNPSKVDDEPGKKFIGAALYKDFFVEAGFEYESLSFDARAVLQLAADNPKQVEPENLAPIYLRRPDVG